LQDYIRKKPRDCLQEQTVFVGKILCVSYLRKDFKFNYQNNRSYQQLKKVKRTITK